MVKYVKRNFMKLRDDLVAESVGEARTITWGDSTARCGC